MPKKWHDITVVYGYEIHVPGNVDTTDYINRLIQLKSKEKFGVYTLVQCISNGWHENQVVSDDVFPIIGFEVDDVIECAKLCSELDYYLQDNPIYEGISCVETPKIFSGINIDSIRIT